MAEPVTAPEFPRVIPLDRIGARPMTHRIEATEDERKALAARFGLISIARLTAEAALSREGDTVRANGRVAGEAEQSCVVTSQPLPVTIDEAFELRFVREAPVAEGEEIELREDECDTMFFDGRAVDLGEAAAASFALALDPFPRAPDAEAALREAGVLGEDEARPISALAGLGKALEEGAKRSP